MLPGVRHVAVSSFRKLLVYFVMQDYVLVVLSQGQIFFYSHILDLQICARIVA